MNREILGKSIYAKKDLNRGKVLTEDDLCIASPGNGLSPNKINTLIGKKLIKDIDSGEILSFSHVSESDNSAKNYNFNLPFGVPVRFHDFDVFKSSSNLTWLNSISAIRTLI